MQFQQNLKRQKQKQVWKVHNSVPGQANKFNICVDIVLHIIQRFTKFHKYL